MIRTRFAPSPTGDLHLGGALVAVASFWLARRAGGAFVMRLEDLDPPRIVAGSAARILEDTRWLGLTWDETYAQSERLARYREVVDDLTARGLTYPCDCSRAEIARAASAPHAGEETAYPGTCRDLSPTREMKRSPATRLRVPEGALTIDDAIAGVVTQDLARDVGDFVVCRGDGVFAYQLAVTVDDVEMGITDVVRGVDLLASTPRQAYLAKLLGAAPPRTWHVPLVVDANGERLSKRSAGAEIRALAGAGISREAIVGAIGHALGLLAAPDPCTLHDLLSLGSEARLRPRGLRVPEAWARATQLTRNER